LATPPILELDTLAASRFKARLSDDSITNKNTGHISERKLDNNNHEKSDITHRNVVCIKPWHGSPKLP
jgi:hypothetical protein